METPPAPSAHDVSRVDAPPASHHVPRPRSRPVHLRARFLLLVLAGGTLGTAARQALVLTFPTVGIPWTIFAINIAGAFILGVLLDSLVRCGLSRRRSRTVRLLLGTGFLGGFTTYSALATDTAHLIGDGSPGRGMGYAVLTVVVGAVATWGGIATATAVRPHAERAA